MVVVLFPTMTFAVFFVVVLGISWRLSDRPLEWRLFVLAASYVFYGWWDARFCLLLAGSTVVNHLVVHAISRARTDRGARAAMVVGVVVNLVVLGFFKYYGFFVDSLLQALEPLGLAPTSLLIKVGLPIGVSFFTFCAISYVVDVYRQRQDPIPLLDFAVYLSFFPHLVAGPIVRVSEFAPQLQRRRNRDRVDAVRAARLICRGMFKKVVIANYLATAIVDPVFAAPGQAHNLELVVAAVAYAVQIYADFSGYTDMAIGIALLLGITLPLNFDSPYAARSLQTFWRSWHMTLSRFLRDYVYIPLGGNRRGTFRTYLNLILTMVIGGLWHGAGLTFIIWGLLHGVGLVVERAAKGWSAMRERVAIPAPLAWFLTFQFVCVAWVFFRADSVGTALAVLGRSFTAWDVPATLPAAVWVLVAAVVAVQFVPPTVRESLRDTFWALRPVAQAAALALVLFVVSALSPEGPAAFIYAGF